MKASHHLTNYFLGALILLSLALSSPAILPGLLAGTATTMLMVRSLPMHISAPSQLQRNSISSRTVPLVRPLEASQAVHRVPLENGRGVVVFSQVNGKLTSRCFYNVAV